MINPHLKTKTGDFFSRRHARLLEPAVDVRSNEELYAAVEEHGKAVVLCMDINNPLATESTANTLTPEEFRAVWEGD